jgi:hypothetical protein
MADVDPDGAIVRGMGTASRLSGPEAVSKGCCTLPGCGKSATGWGCFRLVFLGGDAME